MNREWFKNRANQKLDESIDLLYKVKDNIQYIKDMKGTYGYELDTILRKYSFHIIEIIDNDINECIKLVRSNSIETMKSKAFAQKVIVDENNVYCPACKELIADTYQYGVKYVHKCPYCNQK